MVQIRIIFAAEPARETEVRDRIEAALSSGRLSHPDGGTTAWQLLRSQPGKVSVSEADHAEHLTRNGTGSRAGVD